MHEDIFDPFALSLDKDIAFNLLQTATQGADDGELFFERRRSETLVLDDQRIKTANFDASEGFGLRACLLYTSPSPRDRTRSRMPSSA